MTTKIQENSNHNDFGPEIRYHATLLSDEDLANPKALIGRIVHVKPLEFLSSENKLKVGGKNFEGIIEASELSIYPLTCFEDAGIPKFLYQVFKSNSCLTAEIIGFKDGVFLLSRKNSMQQALKYLNQLSTDAEINAFKVFATSTCIFLDIGAGINAILPVTEITISRINAAKRFENFNFIQVLLIEQSSEYTGKFISSYRRRFPLKDISEGDIVQGEIIGFSPDRTGLFVELTPNQSGLTDTDLFIGIYDDDSEIKTLIGKTISFRVKRIREPIHGGTTKRYQLVPIF